ncbi:M24 family metallopeptidase [Chloroflexota bacterium]
MDTYRTRWERMELIRREKFDIVLPRAMRENDVDMWIHAVKHGNPDALGLDLGIGVFLLVPEPSDGSTSYFVFTDRGGDRIERAILGGDLTQGEAVYDIFASEGDLGQFVAERDPKRIAVNMSGWAAAADGLSYTGYHRLVDALGEKYEERLVSSEQVVTDYRDRRVISEIVTYGYLCEKTRQIIERALSNEVITPGVTSREDVGWWLTEQVQAIGLESRRDVVFTPAILHSSLAEPAEYQKPGYVFQRGDLFQLDWGFEAMNMGTDMKRTAYMLPKGEMAVPAGVQGAWDQGLKARQVLRDNIKVGRTATETLKVIGAAFEEAGFVFVNLIHNPGYGGGWDNVWREALDIRGLGPDEAGKTQVSIDCHCVGNTGDSQVELGPAICGFRPGRAHLTIKPNHLLAFEMFANSPVPEWGKRIRFGIEDNAIVTEDGVQFMYPPNSRVRLIS